MRCSCFKAASGHCVRVCKTVIEPDLVGGERREQHGPLAAIDPATEVANSGRQVRTATKLRPITMVEMPRLRAKFDAPATNRSAL